MQVTWAVQANLLNAHDVKRIESACEAQGHCFCPYRGVPFSDALPDSVPTDVPTLFYGSARQTIAIARSGRWRPGVFFDDTTFCYSAYCAHLGDRMLNADAHFMSARKLANSPTTLGARDTYFVRPDADDKAFAGTLMTGEELVTWAKRLCDIDAEMDLDAPMVVAKPRAIDAEWRLFMRGDEVITASQYRAGGEIEKHAGAPRDIIDFARQSAKLWRPAPAFVMDIALLEDGSLHIIEFNGINSSGFYHAEIPKIIASLSELALDIFSTMDQNPTQ